jgi:hypothetical protein
MVKEGVKTCVQSVIEAFGFEGQVGMGTHVTSTPVVSRPCFRQLESQTILL